MCRPSPVWIRGNDCLLLVVIANLVEGQQHGLRVGPAVFPLVHHAWGLDGEAFAGAPDGIFAGSEFGEEDSL